ncbi:DUF4062 domain-containing protein [Agrobacterium rosae]|uniref:DUF4062 domain-containing protein n=1 Tax=Agrobacterium rosae TaxID=1972867 RepID=UPI0019D3A87C|nr:DUF4062 domain-containing protein [Agrobacterium rosae]MBN7807271.1 DUF4062 domain-containing protein [Agrobacterium rosae]
MAAKKYQVFVSSTFRDLVNERQDTIRNILDLNHIPAGMELFPAADVEQLSYIKKVIDECDYYLLIVGGRYGSLDAEGISFTEREYDYAVETGKFVIAFVHGEPEELPVKNSDITPELAASLKKFREKVMDGRLVRSWTNRQDLQLVVLKSLMHAFSTNPQVGWIRGNAAANDEVLEQSNKALQENVQLRQELADIKRKQQPVFDDLASLDDSFKVRFTYSYFNGRQTSYPDDSYMLTWRRIFVALAAELTTAKIDEVISTAVSQALKESGYGRRLSNLNKLDKAQIKVQFHALGLIDLKVSQTTKGGVAEFIYLSEKGRSLFMEAMAVRRKNPAI